VHHHPKTLQPLSPPTSLDIMYEGDHQAPGLDATWLSYPHCDLGHGTGSAMAKVSGGNLQKYLQVNTPVLTGSWCLNTCADGGGHLNLKNPPNPQVPLRKLPYLVNFTCMGVMNLSTGTCGSHLSQMAVTTLVKKKILPTGIICGDPMDLLCYALL